MKKRMLAFLLALLMFVNLCPTALASEQAESELLVMYYLLGSNIESVYHSFTKDTGREPGMLHQLFSVDLPENVKVVIQTGGCDNWGPLSCPDGSTVQISSKSMQRYLLADDSMMLLPGCEELGSQKKMSSASAVRDFMQYAVTTFPSKRVVMIMCDHGGGSMLGYGDMGTLEVMRGVTKGISAIRETLPDFKLDVFDFDACLQGSLEYAMMLRDSADFFVGSEQTENGGQYHDGWLQAACDDLTMSTETLAKTIVDCHMASMESRRVSIDQTLSAMDLSKVTPIAEAYADFLALANERLLTPTDSEIYFSNTAIAIASAKEFSEECDMVDLLDLCRLLKSCFDPSAEAYPLFEEKLSTLEKAVSNAVYTRTGRGAKDANGISTYAPLGMTCPLNIGMTGIADVLTRAYGEDSPITRFWMKVLAVESIGNPNLEVMLPFFENTWAQKDADFSMEWAQKVSALFVTDEKDSVSAVRDHDHYIMTMNPGLTRRVVSAEMNVIALTDTGNGMLCIGNTELGWFTADDQLELYFPIDKQLVCNGQWIPYTVLALDEEANTLMVRVDGELDDAATPQEEDDWISVQLFMTIQLDNGKVTLTSVEPKSDYGVPSSETTIGEDHIVHVTYPAVMDIPAPEIDLTLTDSSVLTFEDTQESILRTIVFLTLTDVFRAPVALPVVNIKEAAVQDAA